MSNDTVIQVDSVSKRYRLGVVGTGTLSHDLNRWWAQLRGKPDPYLKIGANQHSKFNIQHSTLKSPAEDDDPDYTWALRDVSFEVKQGEVLGIIGRNGAGKSTLLKILSRVTAPTTGEIRVKGRIASLLEVGTGFHPELTGKENIFLNGAILGMTKAEIRSKLDEIIAFAEVEKYIDTPVKRYSSGMYVRLAFAVAAHLDPEILIVDEVLAVGDAEFQKKCLGKMQDVAGQGRTVLFVSHNMAAIRNLCNKAILLQSGTVRVSGEADDCIGAYMCTSRSNRVDFSGQLVKNAQIIQEDNTMVLRVQYSLPHPIALPCLGFLITDTGGTPLFGANPKEQGVGRPAFPKSAGCVCVRIKSPKLRSGRYGVSLWFGDGQKDFFTSPNCLQFEVVNIDNPKEQPGRAVGAVTPECDWLFE